MTKFQEALGVLSSEDRWRLDLLLGDRLFEPLCIGDGGTSPTTFFWQLEADLERYTETLIHLMLPTIKDGLFHTHLMDNESTILSGGYDEFWRPEACSPDGECVRQWRPGDVITRRACEGHHLTLPPGVPYCISAFTLFPATRCENVWAGSYQPGGRLLDLHQI